jgi:hypothetical protein
VFVNPPYGRELPSWVAKAAREVAQGHAQVVLVLMPARTDTRYWTYSTERAIPRHKLYPFAGKGFNAFVGPPDNFRYFQEPVLFHLIQRLAEGMAGHFSAELPVPKVKTAILAVRGGRNDISSQRQCYWAY